MGDLERLERLRAIDDDFMRCVFRGNLPLAQEVLRILTGMGDLTLTREETQRDLRRLAGSRSVELDVWGVDSSGTEYDLEVQCGGDPDPRRARYHAAAMDVEALGRGRAFRELPDRWVIFVMEDDPFRLGRGLYPLEARDEWGTPLGDGAHVLYANGSYRGDDELGRLMADLCETDPDRMRSRLLADRVRYYKRDERGVREMCEIFDEVRAEGERKGIQKGIQKGIADSACSLMAETGWAAQRALDVLGVPTGDRPQILAMISSGSRAQGQSAPEC